MIKAVITDIEGTTTSLSFVKDVLFPYARAHLADYVQNHADDPAVKALLDDVCQVVGTELTQAQILEQLTAWIDSDQKITPLKSLQGLVWEYGYQQGAFTGHLYADVPLVLRAWVAEGLALYIYSSGSVQAQKLLFAHTEYGDLTPLLSGYFDTHIGGKREPASYQAIASTIGLPAEQLLFLSDIKEELDAAKLAGLKTIGLNRDGLLETADHPQASSFASLADLAQVL
ncbi:acireductone synthase [Methylosoma difficile]